MSTTTTTTTTTTTATTTFGRLRGAVDDGVVVFRGIPYAQPPLGPLRFAPPARLEGWSGVRSAERFGPAPMQTASAALGERLVGEIDEDCLSLNVWTPALDDRRRPVLVWFHGGAFLYGAGSSSNGGALAIGMSVPSATCPTNSSASCTTASKPVRSTTQRLPSRTSMCQRLLDYSVGEVSPSN